MSPTIKQAEDAGCEVSVQHWRYPENDPDAYITPAGSLKRRGVRPSSKGGATIVEITFPDGTIYGGVSFCNKTDNFNKKLGRTIALGRAIAEATGKRLARAERKAHA